ncbi:MAG: hypothetical protein A2X61_01360 [Ignavibacteria bacterium GWB2_35_12]|nr:MAG: hypothetical protein A2X61_01360 [Ignavibacteria bacterium GWB2_35_12]OGV23529.1 MAG: hypothetical protein A2475_06280 [Ignavibacteria bacterium RIFOXYC2_FULL_35_21]
MEILIAILWYLQLLLPGVTYAQTDVELMLQANQPTIDMIQQDPMMTNQIMDDFNTNADDQTKKIIEEWEDPPPDPILD